MGLAGEGQRHQQGGEKLAGHVAAHAHGALVVVVALADVQRRIAGVAAVIDVRTQLAQSIHQVANRALVHPRHAVELVVAAQHGQGGGERAESSAGIAQKQIGFTLGKAPVAALHR